MLLALNSAILRSEKHRTIQSATMLASTPQKSTTKTRMPTAADQCPEQTLLGKQNLETLVAAKDATCLPRTCGQKDYDASKVYL